MGKNKHNMVIIIPDEGYSVSIYNKAIEIYRYLVGLGHIPMIIVSGASRNPDKMRPSGFKRFIESFFAIIPVEKQIEMMLKAGIKNEDIFHEHDSMNTRENAINSLDKIEELGIWTDRVYLIGSIEGMLRKLLTFKRARFDLNMDFSIIAISVVSFSPITLFIARLILFPSELLRIWKYSKQGHI